MTTQPFWKMHGAGNDFIVFEASESSAAACRARQQLAVTICDRHQGVGADGLIVVLPSDCADRRMEIINADGSLAEMCVNGIRCFTRFCLDRGLVSAPDGRMTVETLSGIVPVAATRGPDGTVREVRLELAAPDLCPASVGVRTERSEPVLDFPVTVSAPQGDETIPVALVSMGNPHAVHFTPESPETYPLEQIGPLVEWHPDFSNRTNFEVVRVLGRDHVEMRVWERGVGETQACGSGACAVVVAAHIQGEVDDCVDVSLPGGTLKIEWTGQGPMVLSGPVARVFEAEWQL